MNQKHICAILPVSLRFVLFSCLGDKSSNLKFASILSVAFPIHMHCLREPRAKMPLCSVTNKPGAFERSNRMLIKGLMRRKNKQTNYCASKNSCYQEIKTLHVAHAACLCLCSTLLFKSGVVSAMYKDLQKINL